MSSITLFYDAKCPLCAIEMKKLTSLDKAGRITLVDIHSDTMAQYPQVDVKQADKVLHGITQDHQLLLGLDAIYFAWSLVGKGWLYAPTRWSLLRPLSDKAYLMFAKHRIRLSQILGLLPRCSTEQCQR